MTERFKTQPSPERPPTNAPGQQTYDQMLLALMLQVWEEAKKQGLTKDDPKLRDTLVAGLKKHVTLMGEHQERLRKDLETEEAEMHKKITSDDIHEGFESHVRTPRSYEITDTPLISRPLYMHSTYHRFQNRHPSRDRYQPRRRRSLPLSSRC